MSEVVRYKVLKKTYDIVKSSYINILSSALKYQSEWLN